MRPCQCELRLQGQEWSQPSTGDSRQRFTLESAARCVSKTPPRLLQPPVRHDCGDDAFFLAGANQTLTVGVADGVSSWARYGINPALFAWELMVRCEGAAMNGSLDAGEILSEGFETAIRENARQIVGSSTACIASLDCGAGELEVANLGDSGALVVQPNGHVCLETKEQQHYFNCPYQLVCVPPRRSGGSAMSSQGDLPASSERYATDVRPGDVLILATDGFFDNVWKEQAVSVVLSMASAPAAEIADRLVRVAYAASQSLNETPFGRAAAQHGIRHKGGKPDDITVLVARVAHFRE